MDFTPSKHKETAIAELLGCRDFVLITATDIEDEESDADTSYQVYYSDLMVTKGLVDYAAMTWENKILGM
jgi:hypothetical protein